MMEHLSPGTEGAAPPLLAVGERSPHAAATAPHASEGNRLPTGDPCRWSQMREERRLLARYLLHGDRAARRALAERFLPLARQLAGRYRGGGEPLDDLVQVASLGLLKAIDRFDLERATAFSSFAVPTILGELRRHFRDTGWALRLPRELQELALRLERVGSDVAQATGHTPTIHELAQRLGVTPERVLEARAAAGAHRALSLVQTFEDADGRERTHDAIGAEDPGYGQAVSFAYVEDLMCVLSDRDRDVLRLRFSEDLTQSEIGARLGISQMQVSRIIRAAVERLREAAYDAA